MSKHVSPEVGKSSFHCPRCGVFSEQTWSYKIDCLFDYSLANKAGLKSTFELIDTYVSKCKHCDRFAIWIDRQMIYPLTGNVELANEDLPEDIKAIYNEAKNVVNISSRSAAALLRLAVQKLCIEIGEKGKNINDDIASLVAKGLPVQVQQALDILRVVGNHAVHPGTIDIEDSPESALALFGLINIIANHFLTQPKAVAAIYAGLPEKDRLNIARRDS